MLEPVNLQEFLSCLSKVPQSANNKFDNVKLMKLRLDWVKAVSEGVAKNGFPIREEDDGKTLVVVCSNGCWADNISWAQLQILEKLGPQYQYKKIRTFAGYVPDTTSYLPHSQKQNCQISPAELDIEPATEKGINQAIACINDEALKVSVQRYLRTSVHLYNKALEEGAHICPRCQLPTKSNQPMCTKCLIAQSEKVKWWVIRTLNKYPWYNLEDVNKILIEHYLPELGYKEYLKLKNIVHYRMRGEIWKQINQLEPGSPLPSALRTSIIEMVYLINGTTDINEYRVRAALRPQMAKIYLEDKVYDSSKRHHSEDGKSSDSGPTER